MLSILEIKNILNDAKDFVESKNYYYETHICESGQELKVKMDYKIKDEVKGEIVKFGLCPVCGVCYYHNDYESQ